MGKTQSLFESKTEMIPEENPQPQEERVQENKRPKADGSLNLGVCCICYEEVNAESKVKSKCPCKCVFCRECLADHFKTSIVNQKNIQPDWPCPKAGSCTQRSVVKYSDAKTLKKYFKLVLAGIATKNEREMKKCPHCGTFCWLEDCLTE